MDSTRLAQIRKDFYISTRLRVEAILGKESLQLKRYRHQYEKELKQIKSISASNKKQFVARLKQAQTILVGDFHVVKQSARGLLRILRKMKPDFILCLECLRHTDQKYIDQFLAGHLSEKEFLAKVQWKKNWSFPWENYRPLFKWAQQHQIKVFGINGDGQAMNLSERDKFSAQVIQSIRLKHKSKQIFIQYGDLHLASAHLPKQIKKLLPKEDLCVVYQSPEIIYFKVMEKQIEHSTDVVRLTADRWALNVLPPWVKWQDYLLYLESGFDKRIRRTDSDLTDNVAHTVQLLSESFGFKVDLSALSVYSSNDDTFFDQIETLPMALRKRILENIQDGQSIYIPEIQLAYLSRLSVNHVARVAAQYIYFLQKGFSKSIIDPKKDFLKLIWLEMVTYLCSKFANPKRKSDTLQDIRSALQKEQFDDRGKEALMLALNQKLIEMQFVSLGRVKNINSLRTQVYNKRSYTMAAQILGGIMGEKFYLALTKKQLRLPADNRLIFKDLTTAHFSESYYESLDFIESLPTTFKSKFDKL